MNKNKWRKAPLGALGLKLAEETGETISEINDWIEALGGPVHSSEMLKTLDKLIAEAEQVRFIAGEIVKRADDHKARMEGNA